MKVGVIKEAFDVVTKSYGIKEIDFNKEIYNITFSDKFANTKRSF